MRMERRMPRTSLVLLGLVAAACGNGGKAPAADRAAWSAGQAWRTVEEARIGGADGAGAALGSVVDVALDPMGRVWIADAQQKQLLVFDAQGRHVRTIGAPGGGPREFAAIAGMDWAPDGTLWVLDGGNARFAVYDTAGALVRTQPRGSNVTVTPWPGGFDRAGRLYDMGVRARPGGPLSMVVLRSALGQPPDTLPLPELEVEFFEVRGGAAGNRTVTRLAVPYSGVQLWSFDPEGNVWIANTAEYRIESHAFGGGAGRVVERDVERVPVTREDRARVVEENQGFIRQGGKIDLSRLPAHHPALRGFVLDDTGHLWVSPVLAAAEGDALDVFAPDGGYLGRVPLPGSRMSVRAIRGNQMAVVAKDSLDTESVVLLRIVKPAG
jgi:6-bladed beta-propeller